MKKLILILSTIILLLSCETRNFQVVGNVFIYKSFHMNEDDPFTKVETIYEEDIRKYLDDVPDNAKITDVNITAVGIRMIPKPDNKTSVVRMFGTLDDHEGSLPLFPDQDFVISNSVENVEYIPLETINKTATTKLLKFTKNMLLEDKFGDIDIIIDGYSKTGEYNILAECEVQVQIQVLFDVQKKAPKFIADPYSE